MEAVDKEAHENWAKQPAVLNLMQLMLAFPEANHSSAVRGVLRDSLLLGHAVGLFRAAKHLNKQKLMWPSSTTFNAGIALHIWLYHFMGAAHAKLDAADAACKQRSNAVRIYGMREEEAFTGRVQALLKARQRAAAASQPVSSIDLELTELRSRVLPPSILRWSDLSAAASDPPASAVAAAPSPESPPPPGSDRDWQHQTGRLLAFAMGTHPRLGEGYASRDGPCAVRLIAGNSDLLRHIAAQVRDLPLRTLAPPDRETQRLRQLLWQLEQQLHAERAASKELRVQLADAERELARGVRREECASAALEGALDLAHN